MARWRHLLAAFSTIQLVRTHPYVTGPPPFAVQEPHHIQEGTSHSLEEHLDVIKDIEVGPTQVVILTTKEGQNFLKLYNIFRTCGKATCENRDDRLS